MNKIDVGNFLVCMLVKFQPHYFYSLGVMNFFSWLLSEIQSGQTDEILIFRAC
jgi:hypothetical protein